MKHYRILLAALAASLFAFAACDDPLNPEENFRMNLDQVLSRPQYAEGLLDYAYTQLPYYAPRFDEVATDDAVSNVPTNSYRTMATGGWSALSNAQDLWTQCYRAIMNLDNFFTVIDDVNWRESVPGAQEAFKTRLSGEAYALRGMMKYFLLQNHAGKGTDGTLLGFPEFEGLAFNTIIDDLSDFAVPRKSFAESVESANKDFEKALELLPLDYVDVTEIPAKYAKFGLDVKQFNLIFGGGFTQRVSGRIVKAYMARLALLVASPRFNESGDASLWEAAANANADVLADLGGLDHFDSKGHIFWEKAQVNDSDLTAGDKKDTKEMIWRRSVQQYNNNSFETNYYAPSVYGHGQINPTQNFVDAFPMKNGYPIDDPASGYDPQNPYKDRDPRLEKIVVRDGSKEWGKVIKIFDGTTNDAIGKTENSTRTGYYMRKLLREDVSVQPNKTSTQKHVIPIVRATEIYLNYAEAANEAWGPDGKGSAGYSARDVISKIRKRAGLSDSYLSSVTSKEDMRKVIRNERRIELSFEGARFWDLRRWKEDLTEPAMGIRRADDGTLETFEVEERAYKPHQIYGPIPFNEVLKFGYVQNQGW
ncbi:MAG: RagB/SusD family nutrient uptake outer membrane protein [Bacteroidales bacterium]|nr:RagB/SusD family nutrient uptake outer membrane protein [Bacteroidales bacterium]